MGSTVFRNSRALSSALAALGTLQARALGFLITVDPLDTVSNCYIEHYGITVKLLARGCIANAPDYARTVLDTYTCTM